MPAYRSKMRCAHSVPAVPRPRKVLTADEKEDAKIKRALNKMLKEQRVEWEAGLPPPWVEGITPFRHPVDTHVMFKSDAKKTFGLTEREMQTLRHESVPRSDKTYFALADAKALQRRKFEAGALLDTDVKGTIRVLKSTKNTGQRCKANFWELYNGDARVFEHIYGAKSKAKVVA